MSEQLAVRIPEAAKMIAMSRSTIYELINSGELKTIGVGRAILIPTSSLKEFVERHTSR